MNPGLVSLFKGTPIVADEVNQNFTYLNDKIVGADSALASQAEQLTELVDRVEVVEATGGPVGPQSPAGSDGADGAMGPQGLAGVDGADGATGPQGSQGPAGPQGEGIADHFGGGGSASDGSGAACTVGDVWLTAGAIGGGLVANGQLLPASSYSSLYSLLGTAYGGNGAMFALPDLRGVAPKSANGHALTYVICAVGVFPN